MQRVRERGKKRLGVIGGQSECDMLAGLNLFDCTHSSVSVSLKVKTIDVR